MSDVTVRPLRRVEYDLLVEQGAFDEDERIELLDGELVAMPPQKTAHARIVEALSERLMPALTGTVRVRVQLPFAADELSEPEPDVAAVPADAPRESHPDVALHVIEVADTSLTLDLGRKARIYAAAGVPAYWVIDPSVPAIHVHSEPTSDGYTSINVHGVDTELDVCGVTLRLRELLA